MRSTGRRERTWSTPGWDAGHLDVEAELGQLRSGRDRAPPTVCTRTAADEPARYGVRMSRVGSRHQPRMCDAE